jgi:hypothetical protein
MQCSFESSDSMLCVAFTIINKSKQDRIDDEMIQMWILCGSIIVDVVIIMRARFAMKEKPDHICVCIQHVYME